MSHARHHALVGLHHITWRVTASAVSNPDVLVDALAWLIGDAEAVETDKSSSYHGPELTLISATTANKRKAIRSFSRLGGTNLQTLLENLDRHMDEQNVLHFRLDLDNLIDGEVVLASDFGAGTVKGQAKFEVYSGQPAQEQRLAALKEALNLAKERGVQ